MGLCCPNLVLSDCEHSAFSTGPELNLGRDRLQEGRYYLLQGNQGVGAGAEFEGWKNYRQHTGAAGGRQAHGKHCPAEGAVPSAAHSHLRDEAAGWLFAGLHPKC